MPEDIQYEDYWLLGIAISLIIGLVAGIVAVVFHAIHGHEQALKAIVAFGGIILFLTVPALVGFISFRLYRGVTAWR